MEDLISREEVKKTLKMLIPGLKWSAIDWMVDGIPSAQQENIRCKDCTAYGEMMHGKDERMICHKFALNFPEDFYCAEAERRE